MSIQAVSHVAVGVRDMEVALGFYRDVLAVQLRSAAPIANAEIRDAVERVAAAGRPENTLRRIEAVLACREALDANVAPLLAVEAMTMALRAG